MLFFYTHTHLHQQKCILRGRTHALRTYLWRANERVNTHAHFSTQQRMNQYLLPFCWNFAKKDVFYGRQYIQLHYSSYAFSKWKWCKSQIASSEYRRIYFMFVCVCVLGLSLKLNENTCRDFKTRKKAQNKLKTTIQIRTACDRPAK